MPTVAFVLQMFHTANVFLSKEADARSRYNRKTYVPPVPERRPRTIVIVRSRIMSTVADLTRTET